MDRLGTTPAWNRSGKNEKLQGHYTQGDVLEQFRTAILDAGITSPDNIIGDGLLHRLSRCKHD